MILLTGKRMASAVFCFRSLRQSKAISSQIEDIDSALDEFDDSIPFDVTGSNLTTKKLDDFWGMDGKTESENVAGIYQEEILQRYTETELDKQANRDKQAAAAELKAKQKQQADKEVDLFAEEMLGSGGTATNDLFGFNPMANQIAKMTDREFSKHQDAFDQVWSLGEVW